MKWRLMKTAPRTGRVVALMTDHGSIVVARFGHLASEPYAVAWFEQDFSDTVGEVSRGYDADYAETDIGFIGWCNLPRPKKEKKEAVPSGTACQSSEHAVPETTTNDAQQS